MQSAFVNIFDYLKASEKNVPKMAFDYINGGSLDEFTFKRNTEAFKEILLKQFTLVDVSTIDMETKVLGQELNFPLMLGAVSLHKLSHPDGELATARAAKKIGAHMLLSSLSSTALEEVAQASDSTKWFQLYWYKDRQITKDLVDRAEKSGYKAIALTVDAPILGHREKDAYNQFVLPKDVTLGNFVGMQKDFPEISGSNSGLAQYVADQLDPSITWENLDWLQSLTNLPILLKGVQTRKDTKLAKDHGIDGLIVSNHGGRQLDNSLSSIECLPRVVEEAEETMDILMDSGIRRGGDIAKALAMGAKAVLIGRPYIWGLGAAGEDGIVGVYNILIKELRDTMAMIGCSSVSQINTSFLEEKTIPSY